MTATKAIAMIVLLGVVALLGFTLYVNIDNIAGAFGDGPPYYGRTTNMDKWANPIPFLAVFDGIVLLESFIVIRWCLPRLRR